MDSYILEDTAFYESQTAYAQSLYEKDTRLNLIDYKVGTLEKIDENTYKVPVDEIFTIYTNDTSNDTSYTSYYEVKNILGDWMITDMKVK